MCLIYKYQEFYFFHESTLGLQDEPYFTWLIPRIIFPDIDKDILSTG
jgi:hypothetical protein